MTIEEKIKQYILDRYSSMLEFTQTHDLKHSTVATILKRGIANSSLANVMKICKALGISADELAEGRIIPKVDYVADDNHLLLEVNDIISDTKARLLHYDDLTLNGKPVSDDTKKAIVQGIEISMELAKKK